MRREVASAWRGAETHHQMADVVVALVRRDRVDQATAAREARERRREGRPQESAVDAGRRAERTLAAIVDRGLDDPTGVGEALARLRTAQREAEDAFARELRASREFSWTEIAAVLHVSRRTAINRWGSYPGGLRGEEGAPDGA